MVSVLVPGYPAKVDVGDGKKTFLISSASAGYTSDDTEMVALVRPLAVNHIPLPVQCWLNYFLTKAA